MQNIWKSLLLVVLGLYCWWSVPQGAIASVDLTKQEAIAIQVSLSNETNQLKFIPDHFTFESGKRYKLVLNNPSSLKHYFTSKDFADAVWTQHVVAGNVEIKGNIHELELRPNSTAEWTFIPIKSGTYELHCAIAGHAEAGMRGDMTIQPNEF
jgi:uncharacterized cupredoxin-like copper-binding protein